MIDSHAHLASSPQSYSSISEAIQRAVSAGVERIIDTAIDLDTSQAVLSLHDKYPDIIIPTIGLLPELLVPGSDIYDQTIKSIMNKLKTVFEIGRDKFKAVGECGLDYYWLERSEQLTAKHPACAGRRNRSKGLQEELFRRQVEFAKEVDLPLVIHSRGAEEECLSIVNDQLSKDKFGIKAFFHSFTGGLRTAEAVWEAGHYISFNGIITYSRAEEIREIFKLGWKKYRQQILAETDSPYLVPSNRRNVQGQSFESTVCEPSDVKWVIERMAKLAEVSFEQMDNVTAGNSIRFYNLTRV
ncbi:MAG: TatD family hydrolase [Patescibacteria group bacterium]|nr:TatD family hydrolase [Patescibacteria group bacterium]